MKHFFSNKSIQVIIGSIVVLGVFAFVNVEEMFLKGDQGSIEYPKITLKAPPQDVIYSRAYQKDNGTAEVQYAYVDRNQKIEPLTDELIDKRTPTSRTILLDEIENEDGSVVQKLKTRIISSPQYFETSTGEWRQIEYSTTTPEVLASSGAVQYIKRRELFERLLGAKPVFAATSTFTPDANTESNSVDGLVTYSFGTTWAETRNSTSGSPDDSATTIYVNAEFTDLAFFAIGRGFLLFDTSSIGLNATITSATLDLTPSGNVFGADRSGVFYLATSSPSSNTGLVSGDFDNVGSTDLGSTTYSYIFNTNTSSIGLITLNSAGLDEINTTGITKFSLREERDFEDVSPGGGKFGLSVASADAPGTADDPSLEVVYTANNQNTPTFGIYFFEF